MSSNILPPEIEEGNIEYKRIIDCDNKKTVKFKTQLLWRLSEGKRIINKYEAIYYIGVEDNGNISGLSIDSINNSIIKLNEIVIDCKAEIVSTNISYSSNGVYAKVIIQKVQNDNSKEDIKIALLGCSESGKTTIISILTHDKKDNGNGSARSNIFRYNHEFINGHTSSIKQEIIGFNDNTLINYNSNFLSSWENIVNKSDRIISLIDLPGCNKYLKTTLYGIMAHKPDYIFIVVSPDDINNSIIDVEFYIKLCIQLKIKFIIILTKIDLLTNSVKEKYISILSNYNNKQVIIPISCVTGYGVEHIIKVMTKLTSSNILTSSCDYTEFVINDTVFIPDVGLVIGGILQNGTIKIGDQLFIGPYDNKIHSAKVISIHKKQIPSKILYSGETGSLIVQHDADIKINKYMMLVDKYFLTNFVNKFKIICYCNEITTQIKLNTEHVIFTGNIIDTVLIVDINKSTNQISYTVTFKNNNINYIKNNDPIVIRYQNNLIVGSIHT